MRIDFVAQQTMGENIRFMLYSKMFLLLVILCSNTVETAEMLPNIDFLGTSYDIIKGNIHSNLFDPGFTLNPVMAISYSESIISGDGRFLIPNNVNALSADVCSYNMDSSEINGSTSYQRLVSVGIGGSILNWLQRFSASAEYQNIERGIYTYKRRYTQSITQCVFYKASISDPSRIVISNDFKTAVLNLPTRSDDAAYYTFISRFGTHYTDEVTMGAQSIMENEFEEEAWAKLSTRGFSLSLGSEVDFMKYLGLSPVSIGEEEQNFYECVRTYIHGSYLTLGSSPPRDGDYSEWFQSTNQRPYPIAFKLMPITDLLTINYFSGSSILDMAIRQSLLTTALTNYCSVVDSCSTPKPDLPRNSSIIPDSTECSGARVILANMFIYLCIYTYHLLTLAIAK